MVAVSKISILTLNCPVSINAVAVCSVSCWGEAEFHAVWIFLVGALYLGVVHHHQRLTGILHILELHQPTDTLVTLGREPFDFARGRGPFVSKQTQHLLVLQLGDVVEVQYLSWLDDSVLGCPFWRVEPIIPVPTEVPVGLASIRQLVGVPHLVDVLLLRPVQPELETKYGGVVQVLYGPVHRVRTVQLYHGGALLVLEEHHPADVPVLTEQVEHSLAVELLWLQAVDHADRGASPSPPASSHPATAPSVAGTLIVAVAVSATSSPSSPPALASTVSPHASLPPGVVAPHAAVTGPGRALRRRLLQEDGSVVSVSSGSSTASVHPAPGKLLGEVPGHLVVLLHVQPIRLGELDLQRAGPGVNVAAVQVSLGLGGCLDILELHHGLDDGSALEHHDPQDLAEGGGHLVYDVHVYGVERVEDSHQDDAVRTDVVVHPHQLLLHLLGGHITSWAQVGRPSTGGQGGQERLFR